jgi:hypothetical protein
VAKPPCAAPGLAARGGTAAGPCHKGTRRPAVSDRPTGPRRPASTAPLSEAPTGPRLPRAASTTPCPKRRPASRRLRAAASTAPSTGRVPSRAASVLPPPPRRRPAVFRAAPPPCSRLHRAADLHRRSPRRSRASPFFLGITGARVHPNRRSSSSNAAPPPRPVADAVLLPPAPHRRAPSATARSNSNDDYGRSLLRAPDAVPVSSLRSSSSATTAFSASHPRMS